MKIIKLNPLNWKWPEINAASSLLNLDERIFLCCDDQYVLYELNIEQKWISHNWKNSPVLPIDHLERKKIKPDFESLLGPLADNKTILLFPSGSKSNRTHALKFDINQNIFAPLDLSGFFNELSHSVSQINIEGAAVWKDNYLFLNRGVQSGPSSILSVNAKTFQINSISEIDFGQMNNTFLHGSELCIFENFLYALAVAEATPNNYDDGEILGSAIFKISLDTLKTIDQWQFDKIIKTEGLCRYQNKWLVTTDPDGVGSSEFFTFTT